mmetsp:Transcript_16382/g.33769  ORF Transcript_16382/g.33769 Transcript_16382/m.33769 type:complete len:247 (+) Transcript_16382:271-1011(+)
MSKLITWVTPLMSSPLAATSVATRMEHSLETNLRSAASRSCCCLSPCTAQVEKPSCQKSFATTSTRRFVLAKITTEAFSSSLQRMSYNFLSFMSSWASTNVCLTALLATSSPSAVPSPRKISTVSSSALMNFLATFRTALGHVAVKKSVCLDSFAGRAAVICLSCGSNPMSNIRSASSKTTKWQSFRVRHAGFRSRRSQRRPGVAMTIWGDSLRNSWICALALVPPYKQVDVIPTGVPNLTHSPCI